MEMTETMKQLNYTTSFILQDVKYQYLLWNPAVHTPYHLSLPSCSERAIINITADLNKGTWDFSRKKVRKMGHYISGKRKERKKKATGIGSRRRRRGFNGLFVRQ